MPDERAGNGRLLALRRFVTQRPAWVAALCLFAVAEACAQTGSWLLVRVAINNGIVAHNERTLDLTLVAFVLVSAAGWLLSAVVTKGMARLGQDVILGLRRDLFDHLTTLSLRFFSEQRAGWIIARLTSDIDAISDVLSQGLPTIVMSCALLPAAVVALLVNDWRLGLAALLVLPPAILLSRWFQHTSTRAQFEVRTRIASVTAHIAESVAGMTVIQTFQRESLFRSRFDDLNDANRVANTYAQRIVSVFFPSIELLGVLATVAVLAVGADVLPATKSARWRRRISCCRSRSNRFSRCPTSTPSCSPPRPRWPRSRSCSMSSPTSAAPTARGRSAVSRVS